MEIKETVEILDLEEMLDELCIEIMTTTPRGPLSL
jgi:hypothetical protein